MKRCRDYLSSGKAKRPEHIQAFMQRVSTEGQEVEDDVWKSTEQFRSKLVAGEPLGWVYGSWLSVQALEKNCAWRCLATHTR